MAIEIVVTQSCKENGHLFKQIPIDFVLKIVHYSQKVKFHFKVGLLMSLVANLYEFGINANP